MTVSEKTVFWNLARYGAPLGEKGASGKPLSLEETLVASVPLARAHPSVAQVWPLVFSRNRRSVRLPLLERLGRHARQGRPLGFLLTVTRALLGDRRLLPLENRLRKGREFETEDFFLGKKGMFYRELASQRTPKEAKPWAYVMMTALEDWRSCFRKFNHGSLYKQAD